MYEKQNEKNKCRTDVVYNGDINVSMWEQSGKCFR